MGYHSTHVALKNQDWTTHLSGIFVEMRDPQDAKKLAGQMGRYVDRYNANNCEQPIQGVVITSAGSQWKQLDWGYDPSQTLVLRLTDST